MCIKAKKGSSSGSLEIQEINWLQERKFTVAESSRQKEGDDWSCGKKSKRNFVLNTSVLKKLGNLSWCGFSKLYLKKNKLSLFYYPGMAQGWNRCILVGIFTQYTSGDFYFLAVSVSLVKTNLFSILWYKYMLTLGALLPRWCTS